MTLDNDQRLYKVERDIQHRRREATTQVQQENSKTLDLRANSMGASRANIHKFSES